jgi:hypothetical protein
MPIDPPAMPHVCRQLIGADIFALCFTNYHNRAIISFSYEIRLIIEPPISEFGHKERLKPLYRNGFGVIGSEIVALFLAICELTAAPMEIYHEIAEWKAIHMNDPVRDVFFGISKDTERIFKNGFEAERENMTSSLSKQNLVSLAE